MRLDIQQQNLIEKYLADKLDEEEKVLFDNLLDDENFRLELQKQAALLDHIKDQEDKVLKAKLRSLDAESTASDSKPNFTTVWLRYIIAAILLLTSLFLIRHFTTIDKSEYLALINKYNVTYPAEVVERGGSDVLSLEYKEAVSLYAQKKYKEADRAFAQLKNKSDKSVLYRANSLIALGEYKTAIRLLKTNLSTYNIRVRENTQWYLAMAYLGNSQESEAKDILQKIQNTKSHIFASKAEELLNVLNVK